MKGYYLAKNEEEVLDLLKKHAGKARIMAGGTDMLLDMQSGKISSDYVVDISQIASLGEIAEQGNNIIIGAAVTHNQLAESGLIQSQAKALAEASGLVGSYQIRNSSTVAGNVVNAQPAADSAVALVALDASAELIDKDGCREIAVKDMYAGVGKSMVDSSKTLVTRFFIKKKASGEGSCFVRLQQRKALALPMLNVAAFIAVADNKIKEVRIVMAPVGQGPVRAETAEQFLLGKAAYATNLEEAAQLALKDANPRDSIVRGSKEYRLAVLPGLIVKALTGALADSKLS